MAYKHSRKHSSRASIRRSTVGPLDAPEDPLSPTSTSSVLTARPSDIASPIAGGRSSPQFPEKLSTDIPAEAPPKDLSFLLVPGIYHPLSQLDIPPPFRLSLPSAPADASLSSLIQELESHLARGHFLPAAHLSAAILTSGKVVPTDLQTVFFLLQIRYACLELTGNTTLAAQEAKALEDLNSNFYFITVGGETPVDGERMDEHIMPYSLRLQALRLQSLGFSDPRRGISSLYDLGLECREQIALSDDISGDRALWRRRLQDIGIRVVNALIEMGDFDTAKRTLFSNSSGTNRLETETFTRTFLLLLKMGDTTTAQSLLQQRPSEETGMLQALLATAEGRWEDAVQQWESSIDAATVLEDQVVMKQNLAVALLYLGRLPKARRIMGDLVAEGHDFPSLTFNLATLYELSMSNSQAKKRQLAEQAAQHPGNIGKNWGRMNADFKL